MRFFAGILGLEPRLTESESAGLPITPYPIGGPRRGHLSSYYLDKTNNATPNDYRKQKYSQKKCWCLPKKISGFSQILFVNFFQGKVFWFWCFLRFITVYPRINKITNNTYVECEYHKRKELSHFIFLP